MTGTEPMLSVTVEMLDLSVLLNIAVLAKARGHVSENDEPATEAIRRCQERLDDARRGLT